MEGCVHTEVMSETDEVPTESPATWENVVEGKAKEVLGHVLRDAQMSEDGEDQVKVAHELRHEFDEEHKK